MRIIGRGCEISSVAIYDHERESRDEGHEVYTYRCCDAHETLVRQEHSRCNLLWGGG